MGLVGRLNNRISEEPGIGRGEDLIAVAEQLQVDAADQRYRWLLDHSPVAIGVYVDERYVYVNDTLVRRMAAQSADQFIGRRITDFVHPDSLAKVNARVATRRREGETTPPLELTIVTFDGTTREVEALAIQTRWEGKPARQVILRDLTEQKATEASLRFQAALVAHASDAIIATTLAGVVTSWNPAAETIYDRSAAAALGRPIGEAVGAALDPAVIIAAGGAEHATHHGADGSALAVRVSVSRMADGYVVLCADHTALRRAEQHFQTVVASLEEGVLVIAADGTVESVNPAARRMLGVRTTESEVIELAHLAAIPVYDADGRLLSVDQRPVPERLTSTPGRGGVYGIDRQRDGRRIWVSANWSFLDPADRGRSSVVVSFTDITEQHDAHLRLTYQATHDLMTGLPNRAHILALITDAISADEHRLGAVLFIDMDKFKSVNDAHGHHVGDTVLQIAAERLSRGLRPNDVVGRVGGDEFVALLAAPTQRADVDDVANQLRAAVEEPITVAGENNCGRTVRTRVSASIGIVTIRPDEQRGAVEILRDADLAMYQAKTTGRASYFRELHSGSDAKNGGGPGW
jgi:diguanylate cyclase (GGDEF)-like protein/PAS domain S-box-containing protein